MRSSLDDRIARATELARIHPAASEILSFYREPTLFQKPIHEELRSSGETDTRVLLRHFPALLKVVRRTGAEALADFGTEHLSSPDAQLELLLACW
jgi:hypothetical protein